MESQAGPTWEIAQSLIVNGGPLGVLVICVGMFLTFMWKRGIQEQETEKLRQQSLERMEAACHASQETMLERVDDLNERTVEALNRNTEAFGRNSSVVERALQVLDADLRRLRIE